MATILEVGVDKTYSSFLEALNNISDDTTRIEITGSIEESAIADTSLTIALKNNLTIAGGNIYWPEGNKSITFTAAEGVEEVTVKFEGVKLQAIQDIDNNPNCTKSFIVDDKVNVIVDKDSDVRIYNMAVYPGGKLTVEPGGKFAVVKEEFRVYAGADFIITGELDEAGNIVNFAETFLQYSNCLNGNVEITNANLVVGQKIGLSDDNATFTANNSVVEIGRKYDGELNNTWFSNPIGNGYGDLNLTKGSMVIENGSVLLVSNKVTVGETGKLNIDDSSVDVAGDLVNNGTINVNNGYLEVGDGKLLGESIAYHPTNTAQQPTYTLTNNGTINVSGESTLTIENVTGSGTILVKDQTVLVDTNIAGSGTTKFSGQVYFEGENNILSGVGGTDFELVVNEGASLLISRFVLGYNRNITVNGLIEDATALTSLDDVICSLKANSSSGFSVGGTNSSVLDVNNAYVDLGSSSWKNATGTYTWTFDNSYVKAASFGNNNAPGSVNAQWTVTFTDSVLAAGNYIKTGKGTIYNFTEGSVATTGSIRIEGELNISSGSVITVTSYQNNKIGSQDEHGDITGTVTVDNAELNITSANQIVEFRGGKLEVTNNGKVILNNTSIEIDANTTAAIDSTSTLKAKDVILSEGSKLTINVVDDLAYGKATNVIIDVDANGITSEELAQITTNKAGYVADLNADGDVIVRNAMTQVDSVEAFAELLTSGDFEYIYINSKFTISNELKDAVAANWDKIVLGNDAILLWPETTLPENIVDDKVFTAPVVGELKDTETGKEITIGGGEDNSTGYVGTLDDDTITEGSLTITNSNTDSNSELRSDINLTNDQTVVIDNQGSELNVTGSINTTGSVIITNNNNQTGANEAVLNGGNDTTGVIVNASQITLNNDGHAVVDFKAEETEGVEDSGVINIVNNSKNTLKGSAEGKIITIKASVGSDGHVADFTATASEYTEIADQTVSNSTFNSKVSITGNTVLDGENKVAGSQLNVNNGATLTVNSQSTLNNAGFLFAGDSVYAFTDSEKGGIVNIQGTVNTEQTNANANGEIIVDGGVLNSPIVVLENGELENRKSGTMTLTNGGKVNSAQFNVRTNDAKLTIDGANSELKITNTKGGGTICSFNNSGTTVIQNGGSFVYDLAEGYGQYPDQGVTNNGTFEISDSTVIVNSLTGIINNGTIKVSGESEIKVDVLNNSGDVTINGSTVAIDSLTQNGGLVTIKGETHVNINNMSGSSDIGKNRVKFEDATIVGNSNIAGDVFAYGKVYIAGNFTVKQTNAYGTLTIKSGATFNGGTTICGVKGSFIVEDKATLNARFFNIMGTAKVNGDVTLKHSDPRQKLLQIYDNGVLDLNAGGTLTIDGHKGIVYEGGTLNINGGTLNVVTWEQNINNPEKIATLFNEGTISVNGGTINATNIINDGIFNINGETTINTIVTGNAITVAAKSIINGNITADLNLKGAVTINGNITGTVTGKQAITLAGTEQTIVLGETSVVKSITIGNDLTLTADSFLSNAAITGKDVTLTIDDDAFGGNTVTNVELNLVDVELDEAVNVNIDSLANIKSINGLTLTGNAIAGYTFYVEGLGSYQVTKENNQLVFTQVSETEVVVRENFTGDLNGLTANDIVETKVGAAKVTVKDAEITVKAIEVNANGGTIDLDVAKNSKLTVAENVGTAGIGGITKLTTGDNSALNIVGALLGSNLNSTVTIGKNSTVAFGSIDLLGGKNTLTINSASDVTVEGDLDNVATIKLANGTVNDKTTLTVNGDITPATVKNTIALGNLADLYVLGNLVNSDANVGSTITAGKDSNITFGGDINYVAKINMTGTLTAANVTGTIANDTFAIADATLESINMLAGKNTLNIAKAAIVEVAGNVENATTLNIAEGADFSAKDITNVNKLTVAKNAKFDVSNITGTAANDTIKFAAGEATTITGNVNLGDGKDTLDIARNLTISGELSNVETLKIAKDLAVQMTSLVGTAANVTIGNNANVVINGNASVINKLTIGKDAFVDVAGVISGTAKKDTLTIGANGVLRTQGIQDIETVNAAKNSTLIVENGYDNDVVLTAGSWKNATIFDSQGALDKMNLTGSVYGNEIDVYDFEVGSLDDILSINSEGIYGVTINLSYKEDDGTWTTTAVHSGDSPYGAYIEFSKFGKTGEYKLLVSVDNADFDKATAEDNKYSIAVQLIK